MKQVWFAADLLTLTSMCFLFIFYQIKEPQLLPCYILKVKIVRIFLISKFWFQLLQSDNCILKIDTTSYWMIVKSVVSLHTAKIGL